MKMLRFSLVVLLSCITLTLLNPQSAFANQGYAYIELDTSTAHIDIGEEFSVAIYVVGRPSTLYGRPSDDTAYGRVTMTIESWLPGVSMPSPFEFVRFDPSSDFPISDGVTLTTGSYNYQCRSVIQEAPADMTGRHLFGTYVFRAMNAGTYSFAPSLPCNTIIETLAGDRGIIWDYFGSDITIDSPGQPVASPPTKSLPPSSPSAATKSIQTTLGHDTEKSSDPSLNTETTNKQTQYKHATVVMHPTRVQTTNLELVSTMLAAGVLVITLFIIRFSRILMPYVRQLAKLGLPLNRLTR